MDAINVLLVLILIFGSSYYFSCARPVNSQGYSWNMDIDQISTQFPSKIITFTSCPYLDTIKRELLDFDFEKTCSVTLNTTNIYSCLICGKYYQGRNQSSPAFFHSLHDNHHVFLNLQTKKFYCLPENYEIIDSSLNDIIFALSPTYTKEYIKTLDKDNQEPFSLDLNKNPFRPGKIAFIIPVFYIIE